MTMRDDERAQRGTPALTVRVRRLRDEARLPRRAYPDDAAFDLYAAEHAELPPSGRAVIGTGIALELPPNVAALTLPRSGLAAAHGISLVNAPGLIDPGYRGEIKLIVLNTDPQVAFTVRAGDRLAQLLILPLAAVQLVEVGDLGDTPRGERGLGSSGRA